MSAARKLSREDLEDVESEQGYSVRSVREVRLREWFSLREADGGPREFARLVTILRAKKWAKEHPERRLEISRASGKRRRADETARVKRWRHARTRMKVFTCSNRECSVQWCRIPWGQLRGNGRAIYCSPRCFNRERYLRSLARVAHPGDEKGGDL